MSGSVHAINGAQKPSFQENLSFKYSRLAAWIRCSINVSTSKSPRWTHIGQRRRGGRLKDFHQQTMEMAIFPVNHSSKLCSMPRALMSGFCSNNNLFYFHQAPVNSHRCSVPPHSANSRRYCLSLFSCELN